MKKKKEINWTIIILIILGLSLLARYPYDVYSEPQPVVWEATCQEVVVTNNNQYEGHLEIWVDSQEKYDDYIPGGTTKIYNLGLIDGVTHTIRINFWAYSLGQFESTIIGPCGFISPPPSLSVVILNDFLNNLFLSIRNWIQNLFG